MTASALAFAISLFLSVVAGVLLTVVFLPSKGNGNPWMFRIFAGGGLGIGVMSCLCFAYMTAGLTGYILWADLALCLLLGGIGVRVLRR